jgi:hypothetical protein
LLDLTPRLVDPIEGEADDVALCGAKMLGRPLGGPAFLEAVARRPGRSVAPRKRGCKPRGARAQGAK